MMIINDRKLQQQKKKKIVAMLWYTEESCAKKVSSEPQINKWILINTKGFWERITC